MDFSGADEYESLPIEDFVNSNSMFGMTNDLVQPQPHQQISFPLAPQQHLYQHNLQPHHLANQEIIPQLPSPPPQTQVLRRPSSSQTSSSQHSPRNTQAGSSASQHQPELTETFFGFIQNTKDALHLLEACLQGKLRHVARRPHDKERDLLIRSGSIFVYEEGSAGIKRWTDGMNWSPSRILNNFLVYRELLKPFPPGEKKKAKKVSKKASAMTNGITNGDQRSLPGHADDSVSADVLREFVGSLVDSYEFKPNGLVKKTISVAYSGVQHHIVSYYSLDDAMTGKLKRVLDDEMLLSCYPRPELVDNQNFRNPVLEELNQGHATFAPLTLVPGIIPQMSPMPNPNSHLLQGYPMGDHHQMTMVHHGLPNNFMPPAHHQGLPQNSTLEHPLSYNSQNDAHAHAQRMALEHSGGHFASHNMGFNDNLFAEQNGWQQY